MNGASAEPWANTRSVPISIIIMINGMSQNFFRTRMNIHNSLSKLDD